MCLKQKKWNQQSVSNQGMNGATVSQGMNGAIIISQEMDAAVASQGMGETLAAVLTRLVGSSPRTGSLLAVNSA